MLVSSYYFVSALLLIIYGTQVCPYLDTLSVQTLSTVIISWTLFFLIFRSTYIKKITENPKGVFKRRFLFDISVFLLLGTALAIFNMLVYGFPLVSGMKLFFGSVTLGFFAASDLTMDLEFSMLNRSKESRPEILKEKFFSLTLKFTILSAVLAFVTAGVMILVIFHDLEWIKTLPGEKIGEASVSIIIEILFIITTFLLLTAKLVFSYTRNLRFYFGRQTEVLKDVEKGKLDGYVPVTTTDEFGVIANYTNHMIEGLKNRTEELAKTQDATIITLASLAETRDNETGQHIIRTQHYVKALAEDLKDNPRFRDSLSDEAIELIYKSAPLHDIGKVGIPDGILLKEGPLTDDEFNTMKKHPGYGRDSLKEAEGMLGTNSFLRYAQEISYTHHEKWDGSGYPNGLKGDEIPVSGRLMALSDVYDALISKRVYKPAFSHDKAKSIILEGKAKHFDPDVVDSFIKLEKRFIEIASQNKDKKE